MTQTIPRKPVATPPTGLGPEISQCPSLSASIDTVEIGYTSDLSIDFEHLPANSAQDEDEVKLEPATLHEQEQAPLVLASPTPQVQTETPYPNDKGVKNGHYNCSIFLSTPAIWYWPARNQHASQNFLELKDLQPIPPHAGPSDPLSGLALATAHTVTEILGGTKDTLNMDSSAAHGLGRLTLAGLKAPRDLTLALAEGFGNVPRLYGDHGESGTGGVRSAPVITGVGSGMIAAGKGLSLGLYDGLTGFVLQPIEGAKKDGVVGAVKGVGKGIGGLVCKPCAGACAVPAYALQGVHVEVDKAVKGLRLVCKSQKWKRERST